MTQDGQELLAYKCACGFIHTDKNIFNRHLLQEGKKEKGVHKSLGRVNTATGEIIMPRFDERTPEQIKATRFAMKKKDPLNPGSSVRQTEIIQHALQVKFVPRVIVCDLTPVMISGRAAAIGLFGWPETMQLHDIIDTIFISWFQDRGIELTSYVVHNPEEQEEIRRQNMQSRPDIEVQ